MSAVQPLLRPYQAGGYQLANRVVMAPLTRCRATNPDLVPTELHARYYSQRASAGLIITEGTWISRDSVGWHDVPGLFTDAQIRGWSAVTDAVHDEGGVIFAQLWHTGSTSHPDFFSGTAPLAPSAVNPGPEFAHASGNQPTVTPRAMTRDDIRTTINDYATAAANAMRAGFDGVQLQAGIQLSVQPVPQPTHQYPHRRLRRLDRKPRTPVVRRTRRRRRAASISAGWGSKPARRGPNTVSSSLPPTRWPPPST